MSEVFPPYLYIPALYSQADILSKVWNDNDGNHFFSHSITRSSQTWVIQLVKHFSKSFFCGLLVLIFLKKFYVFC